MADDSPEEETGRGALPGRPEPGRQTKPLPLRELAEFHPSMVRSKHSTAEFLREIRDEGP